MFYKRNESRKIPLSTHEMILALERTACFMFENQSLVSFAVTDPDLSNLHNLCFGYTENKFGKTIQSQSLND